MTKLNETVQLALALDRANGLVNIAKETLETARVIRKRMLEEGAPGTHVTIANVAIEDIEKKLATVEAEREARAEEYIRAITGYKGE